MKVKDAIEGLGALASEARLAVFRLLIKRGPKGYTPSELSERLGVPAPTLSFHLKELVHAQLIVSRREGRNLYYSPNFERMRALVGFLTENCCSLADEACGPDCQPLAATSQEAPSAPQHRKRA
jgi:ArsR family transcriptional regulator, arsenate/arsenite/antimonite-responsive transcriptional repressor